MKNIRVAVACSQNQVAQHFGHCDTFYLYDFEDGKLVKEDSVPNPGHKPGFLPNYLADNGVNVIVAGGMGGGAIDIFNERKVETVTGAKGDMKTAAVAYMNGSLVSTGSVCHEHAHEDEGCM